MSEKNEAPRLEVVLTKTHFHEGTEYHKGDVIEVRAADIPLLESFKVIDSATIAPVGTKKAAEEAAKAAEKADLDKRVAAAVAATQPKGDTAAAVAPTTAVAAKEIK